MRIKKPISYILLAATMMFNVDPFYDVSSREQISATLRFTGQNAYFYVEDSIWRDDMQPLIASLAKEFDNNIYPRLTRVYGSEWKSGIDGDRRITILITPMNTEAGGYFNPADEFPNLGNEREMIYLNFANLDSPLIFGFLAHEFQHLINFYQKSKLRSREEEVWLNEAFSEYAPTAAGYDSYINSRINRFLQDPSNSLTQWSNSPFDYASVSLFMHYLVEQRGEGAIEKMLKSNSVGIDEISDFKNLFTNWAIASYLDDCGLGDQYCYKNLDLQVKPTAYYALFPISSLSVGAFTNEWSPHWYKISGLYNQGRILKLEFSSKSKLTVPLIITDKMNNKTIKFLQDELYIKDFGKEINAVTLIPISEDNTEFSFLASLVSEIPKGKDIDNSSREELKKVLISQIEELTIRVLELQKELLLVKIEDLKQKIANALKIKNDKLVSS